ncbi:MAG: hypothetical protein PHQ60_11585 [Sideroxydans sp.]|nr:hypothetical protein [Sideroxydans sp.]
MKKTNRIIMVSAILLGCVAQVQAAITNVTVSANVLTGIPAAPAAPAIISAPSDVLDGCATAGGQVGFDEAQGVLLSAPLYADDGVVIPAGTVVDSHMIFLNLPVSISSAQQEAIWIFKKPIVAVMSDSGGIYEAASSSLLGAPSTNYLVSPSPSTPGCMNAAPFNARGLETSTQYLHRKCVSANPDDCYTVSGNSIDLLMAASQPGDWIRVITQGALKVAIDIKNEGEHKRKCIENHKHEQLHVTILGNANVDVKQINTASLSLADMTVQVHGDEGKQGKDRREEGRGRDKGESNKSCKVHDTNHDGFYDLVCEFRGDATGISEGSTLLELSGQLKNGVPIEGSDTVCVR